MRRGLKRLGAMLFRRDSWRAWGLPRSRFNWQSEVGNGTGSSTVAAPLQWIARTFPEAPTTIYEVLADGQEEQQARHEMLRLLARPNPFYSGMVMWMAVIVDWNVDGNGYLLKIRNNAGAVKELWWAPSSMLTPKGTESTFITHYEYSPNGIPIRVDSEDVVHFRYGLDPEDQRLGSSPLKSVLREVFTDDEAANFTAALLRNMGVPGLVVSPEGDAAPGPDDVAATKDFVRQEFTGDKRGEPLVMSGPTKVQEFGFSPEQLNLKALRRIPEERVSAVLGVPAIVAGLGAGLDRSTFSNMAEAREMAYESNIIPAQRILAEDLRWQLLPDFEDDPMKFRVGFDVSGVRVLQEDQQKLVERLDIGIKGGWVKVSEGRRAIGLEVKDHDEIYLRSVATLEVTPGADPDVPPPPKWNESRALKSADRRQQRLVSALDRDERALTAALAQELETDFDQLGKDAASAFGNVVTEDDLKTRTNGQRKAANESLAARVMMALGFGRLDEKLRKRYEGHSLRVARKTVETINTVLELGVDMPDHVENAIVTRGGTRRGLLDIEKQTRDAIIRAIAKGREDGMGPDAIARLIRDEVPAGPYTNAGAKYRSELIARTETKWAQNHSSLEAYRNADTVSAAMVFDGRLEGSDAECMARDGDIVTFDQAEALLADEHPNGSLSFAPVVGQLAEGVAA